jgi:dipeptidase E
MVGNNKRAAVIANSIDFAEGADRSTGVAREVTDLESLGFNVDELDLRQSFERHDDLATKLAGYGLVWARGGNSFLLRQAMQRSGFDLAIRQRLTDDEFVYAGYSAGIVVLAPSLRGLELVDPVDVEAQGYDSRPIWVGLDVVDYYIGHDSSRSRKQAPLLFSSL